MWNPKSRALKSVTQLKKSAIPPMIGIRNPGSITGNQFLDFRVVESRIQDYPCRSYLIWSGFAGYLSTEFTLDNNKKRTVILKEDGLLSSLLPLN